MGIRPFETVYSDAGEIDVFSHDLMHRAVSIHIDGQIDVRISITAKDARALAAQLIAAADHAEGVSND